MCLTSIRLPAFSRFSFTTALLTSYLTLVLINSHAFVAFVRFAYGALFSHLISLFLIDSRCALPSFSPPV